MSEENEFKIERKQKNNDLNKLLIKSKDDPNAQFQLGAKYYKGNDVVQNYEEAIKWFTISAKNGNSEAQYNLAVMYENGEGVKENLESALKWYKKSAQQGNKKAIETLKELGIEEIQEKNTNSINNITNNVNENLMTVWEFLGWFLLCFSFSIGFSAWLHLYNYNNPDLNLSRNFDFCSLIASLLLTTTIIYNISKQIKYKICFFDFLGLIFFSSILNFNLGEIYNLRWSPYVEEVNFIQSIIYIFGAIIKGGIIGTPIAISIYLLYRKYIGKSQKHERIQINGIYFFLIILFFYCRNYLCIAHKPYINYTDENCLLLLSEFTTISDSFIFYLLPIILFLLHKKIKNKNLGINIRILDLFTIYYILYSIMKLHFIIDSHGIEHLLRQISNNGIQSFHLCFLMIFIILTTFLFLVIKFNISTNSEINR